MGFSNLGQPLQKKKIHSKLILWAFLYSFSQQEKSAEKIGTYVISPSTAMALQRAAPWMYLSKMEPCVVTTTAATMDTATATRHNAKLYLAEARYLIQGTARSSHMELALTFR